MKNRIKRLFTFFIGITLLILIVTVDPNFILFKLLTIAVTLISSLELLQFFRNYSFSSSLPSRFSTICYGGILVVTAFIASFFEHPSTLIYAAITISVLAVCIVGVCTFDSKNPLATTSTIFTRLFLVLYPGLFATFLILLTTLQSPGILLATFLLAVYGNDGVAYILGKYLGKQKHRVLSISPKKTLVGFWGGFIASLFVTVSMSFIFPSAFDSFHLGAGILGVLVGGAAIFGDLVESALKRTAGKHNSGDIIPGRGGILDSIDSCVFSAPVFYYAYILLFNTF